MGSMSEYVEGISGTQGVELEKVIMTDGTDTNENGLTTQEIHTENGKYEIFSKENGIEEHVLLCKDTPNTKENSNSIECKNETTNRIKLERCPTIYRTISLYVAFITIGLASSLLGPTLVNLEVIYHTNTARMVGAISAQRVGYVLGAVLCGALFDKVNAEIIFILFSIVGGLTTICAPWMGHIYMFMAMIALQGISIGLYETGGQSYCLRLWQTHQRYKVPILQALNCFWSMGACIGPVIVGPFLQDIYSIPSDIPPQLSKANDGNTSLSQEFVVNISRSELQQNDSSDYRHPKNIDTLTHHELLTNDSHIYINDVSSVRYPYMIVGAVYIIVALLFTIAVFVTGFTFLTKKTTSSNHEDSAPTESPLFRYTFLVMLFIFYYLDVHLEGVIGGLLSPFAIKALGWKASTSSYLVSLFWGCHSFGRMVAVPVSFLLSPKQLIITSLCVLLVAYTCLSFIMYMPSIVMWIIVAAAGLGISTVVPSGFAWASNYTLITGTASAFCTVGLAMGIIVGTMYTAYFFQNYTYLALPYTCLSACILMVIVFVIMQLFVNRFHKRNKYTIEIEVK